MMRFPNEAFSSLTSLTSFSFFTLTASQRKAWPTALTRILASVGNLFVEVVRFRLRREYESNLGVLAMSFCLK